jgi:proton-dependent oligopeptide transporter, POT family
LLGVFIADKFWGQQNAAQVGAIFTALGHGCLAINSMTFFYVGLGFLVIGSGFFKPNISSLVGQLYPEGSPLKDSAYTIFYMGINIGSIFGILICGYLGENIGWHYGFGAAGVGMLLGLLIFISQKKLLGNVGTLQKRKTENLKTNKADVLTKIDKNRISVICILSLFSTIFWMSFEQAGSSMAIFAINYTDRFLFGYEIPSSWFQSLNPIFVVALAPLFSAFWVKLGDKNPSNPMKFAFGLFFMAFGFVILALGSLNIPQGAKIADASMLFLVFSYLFQTIGELCLSPIGLSTVNKLAPPKYLSLMFGIWFLFTAIGNYLSGALGGKIEEFASHASMWFFFSITALVAALAGIVLCLFAKKLKTMMHGIS